jgi:vacuolar-type H+-ATPase subunit E/Vma4
MRHRLEEVMRQEHHRLSLELEELQGRLHSLRESDAAGEQALKRAAEMDHLEEEVALANARKQTIENFFRRLEDEVLGMPAKAMPDEGHPGANIRPRPIYDRPQA